MSKSRNLLESPSLAPKIPSSNKGDDHDFVDMNIFYISLVVSYMLVLIIFYFFGKYIVVLIGFTKILYMDPH